MNKLTEEAYNQIDRFLRNNLDDVDYANYSEALEVVLAAIPTQGGTAAPEGGTAEEVQWRNIRKVVRALADFCFGSPDDPEYGTWHVALTASLTAKDGISVTLEPLPRLAPTPAQAASPTTELVLKSPAVVNPMAEWPWVSSTPLAASPTEDRSAKDYAIEHAGYLVTAAKEYRNAVNAEISARMDDEEEASDATANALDAVIDRVGEAGRALSDAIFEFEKRRDRALSPTVAPVAGSWLSELENLLQTLRPLTAYGVVNSRDVDQAKYRAIIDAALSTIAKFRAGSEKDTVKVTTRADQDATAQPSNAGVSEYEAFEAYYHGPLAPQPLTSSFWGVAWGAWQARGRLAARSAIAREVAPATPAAGMGPQTKECGNG